MLHKTLLILVTLFQMQSAYAKEFLARARIYGGTLSSSLQDVNTELKAQNLSQFDGVLRVGFEAAIPFWRIFSAGMGYVERYTSVGDLNSQTTPTNFAELRQRSVLFIARLPIINSKNIIVEAFSGVGLANTTLRMKTATVDGEFTRIRPEGQFATSYSTYGAAIALGARGFYVVFEAGNEKNKLDRLQRSGTVNGNIDEIDLSGNYYSIGLLFDGTKVSTSK